MPDIPVFNVGEEVPDDARSMSEDWILTPDERAEEAALTLGISIRKGGPGSGHHGHAGRPGKVGGSAPGTSVRGGYGPDDPFYKDHKDRLDAGFGVSEGAQETRPLGRAYLADGLPEKHPELMSGPEKDHALLMDERNRAFAKEEVVDKIAAETNETPDAVNVRIRAWAASASDTPLSQLHQEAAAIYADDTELSDWQQAHDSKLEKVRAYLGDDFGETMERNRMLSEQYMSLRNAYAKLEEDKGLDFTDRKLLKRDIERANERISKLGGQTVSSLEDAYRLRDESLERLAQPFEGIQMGSDVYNNIRNLRIDSGAFRKYRLSADPADAGNQAFIDAVYRNTQSRLNSAGIKYITLYRGMKLGANHPLVQAVSSSRRVPVTLTNSNALESWSTSLSTARDFGSIVLMMTVPASRIWSTARTGPGCLEEEEFILFSRNGDEAFAMRQD